MAELRTVNSADSEVLFCGGGKGVLKMCWWASLIGGRIVLCQTFFFGRRVVDSFNKLQSINCLMSIVGLATHDSHIVVMVRP